VNAVTAGALAEVSVNTTLRAALAPFFGTDSVLVKVQEALDPLPVVVQPAGAVEIDIARSRVILRLRALIALALLFSNAAPTLYRRLVLSHALVYVLVPLGPTTVGVAAGTTLTEAVVDAVPPPLAVASKVNADPAYFVAGTESLRVIVVLRL